LARPLDWERANRRDAARVPPREDPIVAWWIVPAHRGSTCAECGERLGAGNAAYYRVFDQRVICQLCADQQGTTANAKPSRRWLNQPDDTAGRRPQTKEVRSARASGARGELRQ
jgi:hypothetical protein